jgi:hypothetical protein
VNAAVADTLMAIFGLHRVEEGMMKIKDVPHNSWVRLVDGTLLRYFQPEGSFGKCQRLDGRVVMMPMDTEAECLKELGYDDD